MPPTPFRQHPRAALLAACLAAAAPAAAQNEQVTLLSRLHTKTAYSGLWGHTAADGREFALVGELNGTWIVDVSEPRFPKEIAFFRGPANRWREIKTFGHYLYSGSEGHGGLRVLDLLDPESPRDLGYVHATNWGNTHTLSPDPATGRLYVNGTHKGMVVLDVAADPERLPVLGYFTGYFVHDSHHRRGRSYLADYYGNALRIVANANPGAMTPIGSLLLPGRLIHDAWVSDDDQLLLVTDETLGTVPGQLHTVDLTLPAQPKKLGTYQVPGHIAHEVRLLGRTAYQAWHSDGFHVLDVSDPANVRRLARYDTSSAAGGLDGAWGIYPFLDSGVVLVSDLQEGLFVSQIEVAHLNRYGRGTPGTGGRIPRVTLEDAAPRVGASGLRLAVENLAPGRPFAVFFGAAAGSLTIGSLTLLVDPTGLQSRSGTADAQGRASVALGVPADPRLAGSRLYLQVFAVDPGAIHGIAASRGMWFGVAP